MELKSNLMSHVGIIKLNYLDNISVQNALKRTGLNLFDRTIAFSFNLQLLNKDEQELLFDEGDCIPNFISYWLVLLFEIKKIVNKGNLKSFWINSTKNSYFDDGLDTFLELYLKTITNGSADGDIFLVWGDLNQKLLPSNINGTYGLLIPILDGNGFLISLDNGTYEIIKQEMNW